ncbi:hypothetical protein EDE12_101853 [Methylosinus sp. sav-2]|jgi:hypothetical protein|uniref:hypothetical protein n=1 Tax=Methylosinus sp. sav-2 TaxID=2485168 RepID=UPI000A87E399|nr:hypothetical protein [Methylosinus sp. sav-2]TDX67309.1 hypothetical protein EDE12_101853 [Methylosinus sp. sav-2]
MITVSQCAAQAGLASNELVLGAIPSCEHDALLESYLLNGHRGLEAVREMIVADLRGFLDLGVTGRAADLLIVLRLLLTAHPQAGRAQRPHHAESEAAFETALLGHYFDARRGGAKGAPLREPGVVLSFFREGRRTERRAARGEPPESLCGGDPIIARFGARASYLRGER